MRGFNFLMQNSNWLGAGILMTLLSSFGQTYFISIFANEIRDEFSLSHGEWGAIYTLGTGVSAFLMIWGGALADKFRARVIVFLAILGLSLSCIAMSVNRLVWVLPMVILALRFNGQGMLSHIPGVAMTRWFAAARGKALAISGLGFSLGQAFFPMIFVVLMDFLDWRFLWAVAAAMVVAIVPVLLFLLRNERTPQSISNSESSTGMLGKSWTRKEALFNKLFWMIAPAVILPSMFNTALFFHQVHLIEVKGWEHIDFVTMLPVYTTATVCSMLGAGWAIDRWGTGWLMPLSLLPLAGGFIVFWISGSIIYALPGFILIAFTSGISSVLSSAFWAEYYGTHHLGAIKSLASSLMVLGSAIGPGITGLLIDYDFDFPRQMLGIAFLTIGASVLTAFAVQGASTHLIARDR